MFGVARGDASGRTIAIARDPRLRPVSSSFAKGVQPRGHGRAGARAGAQLTTRPRAHVPC